MTATLHPKVNQLNSIRIEIEADKKAHPDMKLGHYPGSVGSILNAYREADLTFDEAAALLRPVTATAAAKRELAEKVLAVVNDRTKPCAEWIEVASLRIGLEQLFIESGVAVEQEG